MMKIRTIYFVIFMSFALQVLGQVTIEIHSEDQVNIESYYKLKQFLKSDVNQSNEDVAVSEKVLGQIDQKIDLLQKELKILSTKEQELLSKQTENITKEVDDQLINELNKLRKDKNASDELLENLSLVKNNESVVTNYNTSVKRIVSQSKKLSGEVNFIYNEQKYRAYIVNDTAFETRVHLTKEGRIGELNKSLKSSGSDVQMITNGGMFHKDRTPVGLLISENKELIPLNSKAGSGNFYLSPNGVFYIDKKGISKILTTEEFAKGYENKWIEPKMATQSGPMLIINGKHNPNFNHGSTNLSLRSGVGITSEGTTIFIISESFETNFFQFATLFKDVFGCDDALFLDGTISAMYTPSRKKELGNPKLYGPLISVTKKLKK